MGKKVVARIKGFAVISDMAVANIEGSRVVFMDGSSIDAGNGRRIDIGTGIARLSTASDDELRAQGVEVS